MAGPGRYILDVIRRRQETWKNRLEEMNDEGKRPRVRPQRRWIDNFKQDNCS